MMLDTVIITLTLSLGLAVLIPSSEASFNLLISKQETESLLGLKAEVTYVVNSKVNNYAVGFIVLVPVNVTKLNFTWYSSRNIPIRYSLAVSSDDLEALEPPEVNVSGSGMVPFTRSVFQISLKCTEKKTAEVGVLISLNVTVPSAKNTTMLNLKRTKVCLRREVKEKVNDVNSELWKKATKVQNVGKVDNVQDGEEDNVQNTGKVVVAGKNAGNKTENNLVLEISKILENDQSINSKRKEDQQFGIDKRKRDVVEENMVFIIVGSACSFLLLILVAMYICYVRSNKTRRTEQLSNVPNPQSVNSAQSQTLLRVDTPNVASSCGSISIGTVGNSTLRKNPSVATACTDIRAANINQQIASISIERDRICLIDIVHKGTFGQMVCGTLTVDNRREHIFIKTVTEQASQAQTSLLLKEGMLLYGLSHPHIQRIKAICVENPNRPLLIYPYISQGNLKTFLQKSKFSPEGHAHTLVTQNIVDMAIQITQAMHYLHRKHIVHKDLATRNCVVDDQLFVRVTDMALSRDLFPHDYNCLGDSENRPIKWLALESISRKIFSPASDVWTFGVTVWELMTLGLQPYGDVDPFEMEAYLKDGYRLPQPVNCPDELYSVMSFCWVANPEERPTFLQLQDYLQEFYKALNRFI